MRRLLILLGILWAAPALAQEATTTFEEEPSLFVTVEPEDVFTGGAYVQGEIIVTIRVTSLLPFEALNVQVPQIKGAEVVTLLKPRMRKAKIYSGTGYVLEQALAIYPEASGQLIIPPVRATGQVEPERNKPLDFTDESPPIPIDVAGISPDFKGDWWMVSRAVTITESWSKPVDDLREGDVVRREITVTARGVPHTRMQMPDHGRTRGVEFSDAGGSGRTERTTDGVVGTLTRAWDLKIGVANMLYVAPMGVHYWDPAEGISRKAAVRGYRIEPLPADEKAIAAALMTEAEASHGGAQLLGLSALGLLVAPLALLSLVWLWALVPTRADRRLRAAATGTSSPEALYRVASVWAADSGIAMRDAADTAGEATRAMVDRLFGEGDGPIDDSRITRELLRLGRRTRIRRLHSSLQKFISELIGQPSRLSSRP